MDSKELTPGTIAVTRNGKLAVVTKINLNRPKYPVTYKTGVGHTSYKGSPSEFLVAIGTVDLAKFESAMAVKAEATMETLPDYLFPDSLKGLKVGDPIKIRCRGEMVDAEFSGYNPKAPKNSVLFRMGGRDYKCNPNIVVSAMASPPVQKIGLRTEPRADADIILDIANVYSNLSPENLTCDGELSRREVDIRHRRLHAELQRLFKELGREVEVDEAYASDHQERA